MIQTNIKTLLLEAGLAEARPTEQALSKMGLSRRRFTQLMENSNITPININELAGIKRWISGFSDIDTDNLIGGNRAKTEIAERFGLTK